MRNLKLFLEVVIVGFVVPIAYAALAGEREVENLLTYAWVAIYLLWLFVAHRETSRRTTNFIHNPSFDNFIHNPSFEVSSEGWTFNYLQAAPPRRTIRVTWYDDDGMLRSRRL